MDSSRSGVSPAAAACSTNSVNSVVAARTEPDRRAPVVGEVGPQPAQHPPPGAGGQKRHNVAGRDDDVERFGDAAGWQVEFGEVADHPARAGIVLFGRRDQRQVDIDADHVVTDGGAR